MNVKGVILAGGTGSRLGELTRVVNKHLLTVGRFPMICHAITKLTDCNIREIAVVVGKEHVGDFIELLGSGKRLNCDITYRVQEESGGIAQALGLTRAFCEKCNPIVILGDNIFLDSLQYVVNCTQLHPEYAYVGLKRISNPNRFGVPEFDENGLIRRIHEKPDRHISDYAVVGVYSYPNDVFGVISELKPSKRGEYEITDVNNHYLDKKRLREFYLTGPWIDAGTPESLFEANKLMMERK